jgi:uncharacterized membrane protein YhaH (DUF805 family)
MKGFPGFEAKRIFGPKNMFGLLLFFFLSQYLVYFGVARYKNFLSEKEAFLRYERLKVEQYINYEQYGSFGFRVLLEPSPLMVFGNSSPPVESVVNIKDIVGITSVYKGGKVFVSNGGAGDFTGIFFVLGSLLMFRFGLSNFASYEVIRFHNTWSFILGTLFTRMLLLTLFFSMVIFGGYFLAILMGISFTGAEVGVLTNFSIYVLIFLFLFYALGTFMAVLLRFKKKLTAAAYLVWFVLVLVAPVMSNMQLEKKAKQIKSNELVNLKKLTNGKNFERKAELYFKKLQEKKVTEIRDIARKFFEEYLYRVIPLNKTVEKELNEEVKGVIDYHEKRSTMIPTLFYTFVSKEFPGTGYYAYLDFLDHVLRLRDDFYRYYFDKRYNRINQSVESFVNHQENVFTSRGRLPGTFWTGSGLTVLYSLLLVFGSLFMVHRRLQAEFKANPGEQALELDMQKLEPGKTYFHLSPGREQKQVMLNFLESRQAMIIDKPDPAHYDPGTSLGAWLDFEIHHQKVDSRTLKEALDILEVEAVHLKQKIKTLDHEIFARAYLALKLSKESGIYVFDDFLERGSRELELAVKHAVDVLKLHAVVIYCGAQMFDVSVKGNIQADHDGPRLVMVDWKDISLR